MSNAAIKRTGQPIGNELHRTIRFQQAGKDPVTMRMGNFVYERDPGPGGPFILTVLSLADRSAANNEPILVISNVVLIEPDPTEEAGEQ